MKNASRAAVRLIVLIAGPFSESKVKSNVIAAIFNQGELYRVKLIISGQLDSQVLT